MVFRGVSDDPAFGHMSQITGVAGFCALCGGFVDYKEGRGIAG